MSMWTDNCELLELLLIMTKFDHTEIKLLQRKSVCFKNWIYQPAVLHTIIVMEIEIEMQHFRLVTLKTLD